MAPLSRLDIKIPYPSKLENYRILHAENPVDYIWSELLRNIDISFVSKHLNCDEERASEYIATSISQSYEYFKASKISSLYTRPLLLYYSLLNLCKGILYLAKDTKPKDYHGLSKFEFDLHIMDTSTVVNNGVFTELANFMGFNIEIGKKITLDDFCKSTLELFWDYNIEFGNTSNILLPTVEVYYDGDLDITFHEKSGDIIDKISTMTNLLDDFNMEVNDENLKLKIKKPLDKDNIQKEGIDLISKYFSFGIFSDNRYYLNLNQKRDEQLPQILNYFGILAILSNFVRYRPEFIYEILSSRDNSKKWFITKLCDVSERVFPNLMMNILYDQSFKISNY